MSPVRTAMWRFCTSVIRALPHASSNNRWSQPQASNLTCICACLRRRERLALSRLLSMRRMRFISGGGRFLSSLASQECSPSSSRLSARLVKVCSSGTSPVSSSPEECEEWPSSLYERTTVSYSQCDASSLCTCSCPLSAAQFADESQLCLLR